MPRALRLLRDPRLAGADPTPRHLRDPGLLVHVAMFAAVCVFTVVQGALEPAFWPLWWGMTPFFGALAFLMWALSGYGRDPQRRLDAGGTRVTVRFRRAPAVAVSVGLTTCLLYTTPAVLLVWQQSSLVAAALLAVMLVLVRGACSLVPVGYRSCRLVLTAEGFEVLGWFERGRLAWDDVQPPIRFEALGTLGHALRVRARPGAPSLVRHRRRLAPRERIAHRGSFTLQSVALDAPLGVAAALRVLAEADPRARPHRLAVTVPVLLSGEVPPGSPDSPGSPGSPGSRGDR